MDLEPLNVAEQLAKLMRAGRIAGLGVFIPLEVCVGNKVGDGLLPVEYGVVPVENRQFSLIIISVWLFNHLTISFAAMPWRSSRVNL